MMASKSTVAIDDTLRKKIKKLAVILDLSQGEVINKAIQELEKKILTQKKADLISIDNGSSIESLLNQATLQVYESDPEFRDIQEKLFSGPETIDDFIIKNWNSGLDE
jgi:predicted transcriptional regulator